jgi:hypothetical protein
MSKNKKKQAFAMQKQEEMNQALAEVKENGLALEYISPDLDNYPQVALAAAQHNGLALNYVPKDLPEYAQIAAAAIRENALALEYIPDSIDQYTELAIAAVKKNAPKIVTIESRTTSITWQQDELALQYVPIYLHDYKEIAMAAVEHDGLALQYVPKSTPGYKDIAMAAVKKNGTIFVQEVVGSTFEIWQQTAGPELKVPDYLALQYVATDLPYYNEIAIAAVREDSNALKYVPTSLYEQVIMAASNPSPQIRNDRKEKVDAGSQTSSHAERISKQKKAGKHSSVSK